MTVEEMHKLKEGDLIIDKNSVIPIGASSKKPRIFVVRLRWGVQLVQEGCKTGTTFELNTRLHRPDKMMILSNIEKMTIEKYPEYYI